MHLTKTDPSGRFEKFSTSLGKGAYKDVFKAFDQEEGVEVAWNQLRLENLGPKDVEQIASEIHILRGLHNDNIIVYLAYPESIPLVGQPERKRTQPGVLCHGAHDLGDAGLVRTQNQGPHQAKDHQELGQTSASRSGVFTY